MMDIGIKFLTPTNNDSFGEKKESDGSHTITFRESSINCEFVKSEKGTSIKINSGNYANEYEQQKLIGYIVVFLIQ